MVMGSKVLAFIARPQHNLPRLSIWAANLSTAASDGHPEDYGFKVV